MEIEEAGEKRQNSKETKAHLGAMVLRTKPEANKWLHLTPRKTALGMDASERGAAMITKKAEEKSAEFVNRMCQVILKAFWTQNLW